MARSIATSGSGTQDGSAAASTAWAHGFTLAQPDRRPAIEHCLLLQMRGYWRRAWAVY